MITNLLMVGKPPPSATRGEGNGYRNSEPMALRRVGNKEEGELEEFEGIIKKIRSRMRNGVLRYNEVNVKLLIKAIRTSPPTTAYPHPVIYDLFKEQREKLMEDKNCVATWANPEAMGAKTKAGVRLGSGEILGVYGGVLTKGKGVYVLDATIAGEEECLIDGDSGLSNQAFFGRINEDILYGKLNTGIDVGGIIYTTNPVDERCELLTDYGDKYKWGHVIEIGFARLLSHIKHNYPNLEVDIPRNMQDLRQGNALHQWIKNLVNGTSPPTSFHSTTDPSLIKGSVDHLIHHISSC